MITRYDPEHRYISQAQPVSDAPNSPETSVRQNVREKERGKFQQRFGPQNKGDQDNWQRQRSSMTPRYPEEKEDRQQEERDNFDLTTQGQKKSTPHRLAAQTKQ